MKSIQIHNKVFEESISSEKIQQAVQRVANTINEELHDKQVIFLAILNGAFMFASDLFKKIDFEAQITFLKVASYDGTTSSGNIKELIGLNEDLEGKTVVIIEDIIDTGLTMESILKQLKEKNPAEIKIATFLFKPDAFVKNFDIHYIGLKIPNDFIVGYGLDYDGFGRNYKEIYTLKSDKLLNIIVFGPPGAGKGTQSKKIIETYNLVHLSTGDILRAEIDSNTKSGQEAKRYMKEGGFVPDEFVLSIIENKIEENIGVSGFILDGFPRTVEQARRFASLMRDKKMPISAMFSLEVSDEELLRRLIERGKTGIRNDDKPDIIKKRIKIFKEKTEPVKDYYKSQGKLHLIKGEGEIDAIFQEISEIIEKI